ncbi:hypothetical protein ACH5RR_003302, partial [Cinchona calisaya]
RVPRAARAVEAFGALRFISQATFAGYQRLFDKTVVTEHPIILSLLHEFYANARGADRVVMVRGIPMSYSRAIIITVLGTPFIEQDEVGVQLDASTEVAVALRAPFYGKRLRILEWKHGKDLEPDRPVLRRHEDGSLSQQPKQSMSSFEICKMMLFSRGIIQLEVMRRTSMGYLELIRHYFFHWCCLLDWIPMLVQLLLMLLL